nr:putative capsid [Marmot picobirnavirus]
MGSHNKSNSKGYANKKQCNRSAGYNKSQRNSSKAPRVDRDHSSGAETRDNSVVSDKAGSFRNEPRWYYTNPNIMDNAIRINYEEFVGMPYNVSYRSHFEPLIALSYYMMPTPNRSVSPTSLESNKDPGALWAARRLYSALSSVTGRTSQYTPSTLCFIMWAIGEMLSMYSFIRRVFGYYRTYNRRNWGVPRVLFAAMSVEYEDFQSNIANYRTEFNTIINDLNKMPILGNVTYLEKCVALYDNVYADMDADMAQLFLLCPASTWYLREDGSSLYPKVSGTVMETVPVCLDTDGNRVPRKLSAYLDILRNQVKYLMESSTLNIVYSDILNYQSKNGTQLLVVPPVSQDYAIGVIYNATVCQQLHHAMVMGRPVSPSDAGAVTASGMYAFPGRTISGAAYTGYTTPSNDVIEDVAHLSYSYNPVTRLYFPNSLPDLTNEYWDPAILQALIYDSDHMAETLDERVDNTRYMITRNIMMLSTETSVSDRSLYNYTASGDHGIVAEYAFTADPQSTSAFVVAQVPVAYTPDSIVLLSRMQALSLPPLTWVLHNVKLEDGSVGLGLAGVMGDLKNVTFLDSDMLMAANKLIERNLLDVRDLRGFTG